MSSEEQSGQERTHEASEGKLEKSRKKGEFARSLDTQAALAYLGFSVAVFLAGSWSASFIGETLMVFLARPHDLVDLFFGPAISPMTGQIAVRLIAASAPFFVLPMTAILILLISRRAIVLAPSKLKPKLSRISPVSNAKQKYGPQGLMEFTKSAIKLTAVVAVLGYAVSSEIDHLSGYARIGTRSFPELLERQFWNVMWGVLILSLAVGILDMTWQRHSHLKRMRMTHQEMKDESKQSEGDPHMRQSRRERARKIADNRMLLDVPNSDVVIVNPTHYAVALSWDRGGESVPRCVAKGVDEMAHSIRRRAEQGGVPIHEDPPTARSVHSLVDVGHLIQPEHYKAVAAAIVFADKMRAIERERQGR